jgi:hypothetical protein
MSKTSHQQFSPESIAQIAVVILSQPVNLNNKMSFQDACARAYNLLVAAPALDRRTYSRARSNEQRLDAMCARPAKSQALHDLHGTELRSNLAESHVVGALPRPPKAPD